MKFMYLKKREKPKIGDKKGKYVCGTDRKGKLIWIHV